jgi:hypothetical protein
MTKYLALWAAVIVLGTGGVLRAETDEEKAKAHFMKGKALVEEGAYEQAIAELKTSYEFNPLPIVIFNIAVSYDKLHDYADAVSYYRKFLDGKDLPEKVRSAAEGRVKKLTGFLGTLKLTLDVEGAEILVDGEPPSQYPPGEILVATGDHELLIRKEGYKEIKTTFTTVSGETKELSFTLEKVAAQGVVITEVEPAVQTRPAGEQGKAAAGVPAAGAEKAKSPGGRKKKVPPAAFGIMVGLTGALVIGAGAMGGLAISKDNQVSGMHEDEDWQSVKDEGYTYALAADILMGVAGASALTTLVLAFFADFGRGRKEKKQAIFVAPSGSGGGMLMIEGRF